MATGHRAGGGKWESPPPPPTPQLSPTTSQPPVPTARCPSSYVTVRGGGLPFTLLPPAAPPLKQPPLPPSPSSEGSRVAVVSGGRGNYSQRPREKEEAEDERKGRGGGGNNNNNKGAAVGGGRGGEEEDCDVGTAAGEADEENCCCWGREAIPGAAPSTPRSFFSPEPLPRPPPASPRLLPRSILVGGVLVAATDAARGDGPAAVAAAAAGDAAPPAGAKRGAILVSCARASDATPPWWTSPRVPSGGARGAAMEEAAPPSTPAAARPGGAAAASATSAGRASDRSSTSSRRRRMGKSERLKELTERLKGSPSSHSKTAGDQEKSPTQASSSHLEESKGPPAGIQQAPEAPCPPPRRKCSHKLQAQSSGEGPSMSSLEEVTTTEEVAAASSSPEPTPSSSLPSLKPRHERHHSDVVGGSEHYRKNVGDSQKQSLGKPTHVRSTSATASVGTDTEEAFHNPGGGRSLTTVPEQGAASKVEDPDDLVPLTLPRAESRSIVGSYARRCIPFRSASFSRVDLRPDGRCYVRGGVLSQSPPSTAMHVKSSSVGAPYSSSEIRQKLQEMGKVSEECVVGSGERSCDVAKSVLQEVPENGDHLDKSSASPLEGCVGGKTPVQSLTDRETVDGARSPKDKSLQESGPGPPSIDKGDVECDAGVSSVSATMGADVQSEVDGALYWTSTVVVPNDSGNKDGVSINVQLADKTYGNGDNIVRRVGSSSESPFIRSHSADNPPYLSSQPNVPPLVPLGARSTWEVRAAGRRPRKPRPLGVIRLDEESEEDEELVTSSGNRLGLTILKDGNTPFELSRGVRNNQLLVSSKSLDASYLDVPYRDDAFVPASQTSAHHSELPEEEIRSEAENTQVNTRGEEATDDKSTFRVSGDEVHACDDGENSQTDKVNFSTVDGVTPAVSEVGGDQKDLLEKGIKNCNTQEETGAEFGKTIHMGDETKDLDECVEGERPVENDKSSVEETAERDENNVSDRFVHKGGPPGTEEGSDRGVNYNVTVYASSTCQSESHSNDIVESKETSKIGDYEHTQPVEKKPANETWPEGEPDIDKEKIDGMKVTDYPDSNKDRDSPGKLLGVDDPNASDGEEPASPSDTLDAGDSPSSPSAYSKGGESIGGEVVRKRTRGKRKTRRREEEQKDVGQVVLPATVPLRKTSVYAFCDDSLKGNKEISQARAANGHGAASASVEAESQTHATDVAGSPPVSCGSPDITKSDADRASSDAGLDPGLETSTGERKVSNETAGCAVIQVTSSSQCDPVRSSASPVQGILAAEFTGDYSARNASPCPTSPLDSGSMSDAEKSSGLFALDGRSPMTPRRYSKRPLRGPYAQMLEAEMKRPEAFPKLQLRDDLKFLEDLAPRSGQTTAPILDARRAGRAGGGHSLDDSALRNSTSSSSSSSSTSSSSSSAKVPPKRKVSAHIPYSGEHLTPSSASSSLSTQSPLVCHQRTTSSPSKLEGISSLASSPALSSLKPRKSTAPSGTKSDPTRGAPSPPPPAEGPPSRVVSQVKKVHGTRIPPQVPDGSGGGARTDILTRLLTDQMQSGGDGSSGKDTRSHVAVELYETERSYVESLQILVHKYLRALKSSEHSGLIDSSLVDEIFFQVPEILSHHEIFLEELRNRLDHWDPLRQQLGDVFLHAFTQQSVIDTYASFISNWKHAKESIKSACQAKPAFARLLESLAREHKGKLAVDSLLIMPVQRIPRYELLIQRLLKHTEPSHPDHPLLVEAATVVRSLAQSINRRGRGAGASRGSSSSGTSSGTTIEAWADSILAGPGGSASSGGSGTRSLLRVDQVTLGGKERSFILFSDLLLIASAKRRSGPSAIRKASTMSTAGGLTTGLEGHKLKLLMRIPLEDLEVVRGREEAGAVRRALKEAERVQEDLSMVGKLSQMAASLHCSHAALDEVLADLAAELRRRAAEASAMEAPLSQLPLALHTQSGSVETLLAVFLKAETRASWEEAFLDAKQKLTALSTDSFPTPEFLSPLPIRKTRAGLQFTCAAPTLPSSSPILKEGTPPSTSNTRDSSLPGKTQTAPSDGSVRGRAFSSASDIGRSGRNVTVTKGSGSGWPEGGGGGEVWVCNSDGYVGQVCVLSLQPEPTVASCNGVCNARILCISAVPAKSCGPSDPYIIPPASYTSTSSSSSASRLRLGGTQDDSDTVDEGNQCRSGDDSRDGTGNIQLDSSSSDSDEEEGEGGSEEGGCTSQDEVSSPPPPSPPTQRPSSPPSGQPSPLAADSSDELTVADPSFTSGSSGVSSCGTASSGGVPGNQATMWLGTEDGCIHVYHCGDNIRTKRNKLRIQHVAAVLCILYLDDRVYVSLANGDIVVYTREPGGGWGSVESGRRSVGSSATPVTRMIAVRGKLWCGGNSQIRILNPLTLVEEHSFEVCEEGTVPSGPNPGSRWAWCLAPAAPEGAPGVGGVWVSLQHSALLRLFSPIAPFPCLCSIDLTPAVGKMLASCDDIIRQHKAACLRVTALLTCQDLLWVGTSAGVILTLAMDRRQLQRAQQAPTTGGKTGANQTSQSAVNLTPTVTGLPHGHTGHVRFLTCVDMPMDEGADKSSTDQKSSKSSSLAGGLSALVAPSSILPQSTLSASPPQSYQGSLTSQSSSAWKGSSHSEEKPTKILVISGGDGYEDFRNSGNGPSSEVAGREDSTNHLLLWQV